MSKAIKQICAAIQAGGPGTRMGKKSDVIPKHLLQVCGTPMVERILRQLLCAGLRKIYIITSHLGEKVEDHFSTIDDLPSDLELHFVRETKKRGDIGSLAELPVDNGTIVWVYGDLVTDLDFSNLFRIHLERRCDVTLASHYETHQVRLGELIVRGDHVIRYLEKPVKHFLICSGIAMIESNVLPLVERSAPMGLDQLVEKAIRHGFKITHWQHGAFWVDVNDPTLLRQAEEGLKGILNKSIA